MSIFTKVLRNDAIYWERLVGSPSDDGQPSFAAPVAIRCRWDDVEDEVVLPSGRTVRSKAALMVDRDMITGSIVQKGLKTDDTPLKPPPDGSGGHEIILRKTYGNIKQKKFLRQVWV